MKKLELILVLSLICLGGFSQIIPRGYPDTTKVDIIDGESLSVTSTPNFNYPFNVLYTYKFSNDTTYVIATDSIGYVSVYAHPSNTGDVYVQGNYNASHHGLTSTNIPLGSGATMNVGDGLGFIQDSVVISSRAAADTVILILFKNE